MIYHRKTSIAAQRAAEREEAEKIALARETAALARMLAASLDALTDGQALAMPRLFPTWEEVLAAGKPLKRNTVLNDEGSLYRVVPESVTPQPHQPPHGEGMLAVYRPIQPEHAGTAEDPIPWVYGIDCRAGQYFRYEGHVYQVAEGGDMVPCIWAPGTAGLWQWVRVEGKGDGGEGN